MSPASTTPCPRCGAAASGPFCANCGAPVSSRSCGNCGATLAAGAKFCHKCGAAPGQTAGAGREGAKGSPLGQGPAGARATQTPWIIATILVVVTVAGIAYSARDRGAPEGSQMANAGNAGAGGADLGAATVDISTMSLSEQYIKLMNKVTAAAENGDSATVVNFTPMALGAYTNLPAADRDIDARYHAAMLETNVGMFAGALALADTIDTEAPNNLMATYVRIIVAQDQGDSTRAKAERAKFRDHFDAEMKKKRSEYEAHTEFLQNYRKGAGAR